MVSDRIINQASPSVENSHPTPDMTIAHEAAEIITQMLGDGRSVLDPTISIWTVEATEELRARIEDNPILGTDQGQWEKLDEQLNGAPREVVLLAAEIVFLREHPVRSIRPETRREHVERVLAHLDAPLAIPDPWSTRIDRQPGIAGFEPGISYNGSLWKHIIWVATFGHYWNGLSESEQDAARRDPWELQRVMLASGDDRSDIRNAMLFLARPDSFEPISSTPMKERIRNGLADRIGGVTGNTPGAVDRDLLAVRAALAPEIDGPFNFWSPRVRELWDESTMKSDSADDEADDLGRVSLIGGEARGRLVG